MKAKNKRERRVAAVLTDGDTADSDAFIAQGELEMKKGSDGKKSLYFFDRLRLPPSKVARAVEMNDYDEEALVARSRCNHILGRNIEAIEDGEQSAK